MNAVDHSIKSDINRDLLTAKYSRNSTLAK